MASNLSRLSEISVRKRLGPNYPVTVLNGSVLAATITRYVEMLVSISYSRETRD